MEEEKKKESKMISIIPLKNHVIKQNEFYYEIKKGEKIEIDRRFLQVLLTEKIITKG